MSVVRQITLLCGWECLLKPVVARTSTRCFCLIEALLGQAVTCVFPGRYLTFSWWASRRGQFNGMCVCAAFVLFIPSAAAPVEPHRKRNKRRWAGQNNVTFEPEDMSCTWSYARSFTAESHAVGAAWCQALLVGFKARWRDVWVNI